MGEHTTSKLKALNCCIIIPTYNNEKTLATVIADVKEYAGDIIVVNDGSTDTTPHILQTIENIEVVSYPKNRGKGYALQSGFRVALEKKFDYAITIDSDGQHLASDIPLFANAIEKQHGALFIGSRNLNQENMPGKNSFANKFSNFWFKVETGQALSDTQSGFRAYPLKEHENTHFFTSRYGFELEILVRSAWRDIPIVSIPIEVRYLPECERVSHFKPVKDFTRISILNTFLVLVSFLWIKPFRFFRRLTADTIKHFIHEKVLHSPDSNRKISLSVALGVFMGIVPVWGYQMIVAFFLAQLFKLNKTITLIASNISIPPMIPFILFGSVGMGAFLLGRPVMISWHAISFSTVKHYLIQYIVGSCVLALVCAVVVGVASWLLLCYFRKVDVK